MLDLRKPQNSISFLYTSNNQLASVIFKKIQLTIATKSIKYTGIKRTYREQNKKF